MRSRGIQWCHTKTYRFEAQTWTVVTGFSSIIPPSSTVSQVVTWTLCHMFGGNVNIVCVTLCVSVSAVCRNTNCQQQILAAELKVHKCRIWINAATFSFLFLFLFYTSFFFYITLWCLRYPSCTLTINGSVIGVTGNLSGISQLSWSHKPNFHLSTF